MPAPAGLDPLLPSLRLQSLDQASEHPPLRFDGVCSGSRFLVGERAYPRPRAMLCRGHDWLGFRYEEARAAGSRRGSLVDVSHHCGSSHRLRIRGLRSAAFGNRRQARGAGAAALDGVLVPAGGEGVLELFQEGERSAGTGCATGRAARLAPAHGHVAVDSSQTPRLPSAKMDMGARFSGSPAVILGSVNPQSLILYSSAL
jgi:hypothetical protein